MSDSLLSQAEAMLADGPRRWPRGAALLTRNALEEWVRTNSSTIDPGLPRATMASQLACLDLTVDPATAGRARVAWHELSEACHHHAYDLMPSPSQVARLLSEVRELTG